MVVKVQRKLYRESQQKGKGEGKNGDVWVTVSRMRSLAFTQGTATLAAESQIQKHKFPSNSEVNFIYIAVQYSWGKSLETVLQTNAHNVDLSHKHMKKLL